jgi:Rieske Fe-S protein
MTTRREFVKSCACAAAAGVLGTLVASCYGGKSDKVTQPPVSGTHDLDLTAYPALATDDSAVTVTETPAGTIFVTHTTGANYFALSRICTHQGCTVNLPAGGTPAILPCPCHGSRYNLNGSVAQGPAPRSLPSWPATKNGDTLTIDFG